MDMAIDTQVKKQVREFYDQVGWQEVSEGVYQNALYDLLHISCVSLYLAPKHTICGNDSVFTYKLVS